MHHLSRYYVAQQTLNRSVLTFLMVSMTCCHARDPRRELHCGATART